MATALLSLGSNIGDRAGFLRQSLELLAGDARLTILAVSSFHETKPAGGPAAQESFLNAAARLETGLPPTELLAILQGVENQLGRVRVQRWGPRTIDLDLLLYDQLELETPELTLPHPRMSFRRFVLEPAAEVAPEFVHPVCGNTIAGLLRHLDQAPRWVFVSGDVNIKQAFGDMPNFDTFSGDRFPRYRATAAEVKQLIGNNDRLESAIRKLRERQWLVSDWWCEVESSSLPSHDLNRLRRSPIAVPRLLVVGPEGLDRPDVQRLVHANIFRGPQLWLEEGTSAQLRDQVLAAIAAME